MTKSTCNICLEECNYVSSCKHDFCTQCFQDWEHQCNEQCRDLICPICQVILKPYEGRRNEDEYETYEYETYEYTFNPNHLFNENILGTYSIFDDIHYDDNDDQNIIHNGILQEYYDEEKSKIAFEVPIVNGKWHGSAFTYYSNGSILRIQEFCDGKKIGFYKEFDENGKLHHLEYNLDNGRHGFSKYFQGALCGTSYYIDDEKYIHSDLFVKLLREILYFPVFQELISKRKKIDSLIH